MLSVVRLVIRWYVKCSHSNVVHDDFVSAFDFRVAYWVGSNDNESIYFIR